MANDYDRILKENIEQLILPIAEKLLGIHVGQLEEIPDDLQITLERKPDFTKKAGGPVRRAVCPPSRVPGKRRKKHGVEDANL